MKTIFLVITFLIASNSKSLSQNIKATEHELTNLEIQWHLAYKLKDTNILHSILANEFINTNSKGNQFGKKAIINALKNDNARYDSIYPFELQFLHFDNSVAVIGKTRETGTENGKVFDNLYFWTDLFVKKQNIWQCVLAQTAVLPKPRFTFGKNLSAKDSAITYQAHNLLKELATNDKFSGSVLIAKDKTILYQGSFGLASKEHNVINDANTAFNLASMTKMFTGIAIAQLSEKGKLSFNDQISKYLPYLPSNLTSGITVHHLLTHTSGLGSYWTDEFHSSNHAAYRTLDDYVKLIKDDKQQFTPGSKWAYSNTGFLLLGLIIEKVSGMNYFDYIKQNIFNKAEMANADFYETDIPNKGIATPYTKDNPYIKDTINWSKPVFIAPVKGSPAGGAFASITDMFHFSNALAGYKLLGKDFTEKVISGKVSYGQPEQQKKYAYGFANQIVNGKVIIFHDGGANGISTIIDIYPELGYTVIILSNYDSPSSWTVDKKIREWITK